jgi:hypothetical protein
MTAATLSIFAHHVVGDPKTFPAGQKVLCDLLVGPQSEERGR